MGVEFDMDVASPAAEIVPWIPAERHFTLTQDGKKNAAERVRLAQSAVWTAQWYAGVENFVAHRNGVILLPGYTYTQWWQSFVAETDAVLFPCRESN
jgi:hypothetical protein